MNYILRKVEVNGNADMFGGRDTETDIALSCYPERLIEYCEKTYNCTPSIGKPKSFEWTYYMIVETNLFPL